MVEFATAPPRRVQDAPAIKYQARVLTSASDLIALEDQWDALWANSLTSVPSARSSALVHWLCYFAESRKFRALTVFANGELAAALPLVERPLAKVLRVGEIPCNHWSPGGDLMMHGGFDMQRMAEEMVAAFADLPWPLLWLDDAIDERPDWNAIHAAARQQHVAAYHKRFDVGVIGTTGTYDEIREGWSRNHRKKMARHLRRLSDHGEVKLRLETPQVADVADHIRAGFEIENLSWKGEQGSSVMQSPGMLSFYTEQAEILAKDGQLMLVFLDCGDRPVAFEYGWLAKHVYHSFKVGYDPDFANYSPGQVLTDLLIQEFCERPDCNAIDCLGPLSDAVSRWQPSSYGTGRLVVGWGWKGRLVTNGYRHVWRKIRPSDD